MTKKKFPKTDLKAHGAIKSFNIEDWDGYQVLRIPSGTLGETGSCIRAQDFKKFAEYLLKLEEYFNKGKK